MNFCNFILIKTKEIKYFPFLFRWKRTKVTWIGPGPGNGGQHKRGSSLIRLTFDTEFKTGERDHPHALPELYITPDPHRKREVHVDNRELIKLVLPTVDTHCELGADAS